MSPLGKGEGSSFKLLGRSWGVLFEDAASEGVVAEAGGGPIGVLDGAELPEGVPLVAIFA